MYIVTYLIYITLLFTNYFSIFQAGSYLSNIGGVLGFWIGFSAITIGEFIEFGLDLCVYIGTTYILSYLKGKKRMK